MSINDFCEIIAKESLDKPLLNEVPNDRILTYGYRKMPIKAFEQI